MKTYWVYLLLLKNNRIYTGVTNNLERRLAEHFEYQNPKSFTAKFQIERFLGSVEFNDPKHAIDAEKRIKKWSHAKKLALINQNWDELRLLAKRKKKMK